MGEEIADVAGDVSAMASKQYSRAQDMAVEAFDGLAGRHLATEGSHAWRSCNVP